MSIYEMVDRAVARMSSPAPAPATFTDREWFDRSMAQVRGYEHMDRGALRELVMAFLGAQLSAGRIRVEAIDRLVNEPSVPAATILRELPLDTRTKHLPFN